MTDVFSRRKFLQLATTAAVSPKFYSLADAPKDAQTKVPYLEVHPGGHFLQTSDGAPFFWLGDTAWQMMHRLTWEDCQYYLASRARQGFTVIQMVALCEFDGLKQPNVLGQTPFKSLDLMEPNDLYFDRLVQVVNLAEHYGLYVAVLPTWGDKLTAPWGEGPRIFRQENLDSSHKYSRYLAQRLRSCRNVVWMLGGDRPAHVEGKSPSNWLPVWNVFAEEIRENSDHPPLILYHPQPGEQSTSVLMRNVSWLSVNGMQSGHGTGHDVPVWDWVARDYAVSPAKPTLDLEPNYEDHPVSPWPKWNPANGYFVAADVRRQTYRSVFAGGCGVTYGHHSVWQFAGDAADAINHAYMDWRTALNRPGAAQMMFLRNLMLSRPYFSRRPAPEMVLSDERERGRHIVATRDESGSYAFI